MIRILVNQDDSNLMGLEITGHALSNDPGKDLVCAAVSAIGTGTLNSLYQLAPDCYQLELDEEMPRILINQIKQSEVGQVVLKTCLIQLQTVQESYPEYLQIKL